MKISKIRIIIFSGFFITLLFGLRVNAQCDELAANYQRYFITHSLNLDPIEGAWKAYRTVKVYHGDQLKRIKKEEFAETWMIVKQDNHYIVCTGNNDSNLPLIFFTKEQSSKYVFNKNYTKQNALVAAYAMLVAEKIKFTFKENTLFLKEIMGTKYQKGMEVEYDYEMVKEDNYATKVTNEVPKIKNFLINRLRSYFNI